jgi:pimeloyl-ACP methyl ester carboxylesterase
VRDRPDRRAALGGLDLPTLVVGGTADPVTPVELATELADGIPGAELVTIDGCGHLSPIEEPDEVARILRSWLSRTDAKVTEGVVGSGT